MALIDEIREKISTDQFELSKHAADQSIIRRIGIQEVLFGTTSAGRPLHVQCSYPSSSPVRIITLYEPTPDRWIDLKRRRPR